MTDLATDGFGHGWGHRRTFSNQIQPSCDRGNGWNWFIEHWPYLVKSQYPDATLAMIGDVHDIAWFLQNPDGTYATLYGRLDFLTHDPVNNVFNLQDTNGNVTTFNDMTDPTRPGGFKKFTDAGGNVTQVLTNSGATILEVQRSTTVGGVTTTESFLYTFLTSGPNTGHLSNVLLRRNVNSGTWTNVRQANYVYYGNTDANGSLNDLQTVTTQQWNGQAWVTTGTAYYRYYTAGQSKGFVHGIKYALNPQAYANLVAAVGNPLTASDAQVAQFADFYFEYDSLQRVTKEIVAAGSRTFTFAYTDSGFQDDFNNWNRKTVETDPDGTQTIVYCNYVGGTILKIRQSGTSKWCSFNRYDSNNQVILSAESSAITGYDDSHADLLNYSVSTGRFQYLSDSSGLIHLYTYYIGNETGAAANHLRYEQIQHGQTGTPILLRQLQYTWHNSGSFTVFPVATEITYPSDTNQNVTIQKSYAYTFFPSSNRVQQKTTTLPVISTTQNGSGTANTRVEVFDTFGNLVWRKDERGFITYFAYDVPTGAVGNSLVDNTWHDAAGNVFKQLPAGSKLFTKSVYDGLNRATKRYAGYDLSETSYADAGNVTGDTVLQQVETAFDAAGNLVQTTTRQRYHNATGTGDLTSPSGAQPRARVTYAAAWFDGVNRLVATADYGTNGGTALSRPSTIPTSSDSCLVATTVFNSRGEPYLATDAAGTVTCQQFDDAGRRTSLIENYQALSSSSLSSSSSGSGCSPSDDVNRTTTFAYTADSLLASLTAQNATTGNQTTQYVYGTTLSDSAVASSLLKRYETYSDSVGGSDRVAYAYNRQAQPASLSDQNGTVHSFNYDKLGRRTDDRITALGTGVDNAVLRISQSYEVRGLTQNVTSYDSATVGSGNVVNDIQRVYNGFAQLTSEYQSHSGTVNTGSTPRCQYAYADGSANTIRPISMSYPNGRLLNYVYGIAGGANDSASRIGSVVDNDGVTHLADYSYLGAGTIIEVDESQPNLSFTLIGTAGGNDPDTGDIYRGLDRFGRVKDLVWWNSATSTAAVRIQHGYDRAGNRLYRADLVAESSSAGLDEVYSYDGLYRVKNLQRGTLTSSNSQVQSPKFAQCWTLDATGNWKGFRQDDTGSGTWNLIQSRSANPVNEITGIVNSAGPAWAQVSYDAAGNMTSLPKPTAVQSGFSATYDAWHRLVKLVDAATGQTVQTNAYDGLRRRTVRNTYSSGTLTETRHYYYSSAWQVLEERVGTSTSAERQFVWGLRYIDDLILRDRDTNADGVIDERLYALQDPNFNVVGLTDSSGTAQERYAYDAYGVPTFLAPSFASRSSSNYAWETLYAGYRWDSATGIYVVRNRILNPKIGTWMQCDPLGLGDDGVNVHQYNSSRPLAFVDPSGAVLIAVDGTGSQKFRNTDGGFDAATGRYRSHVRNFYEDYDPAPGERKMYFDGPEWNCGIDTTGVYRNAQEALDAILKANPNEPIVLVGHSRGGLVVNELARYLQSNGFKVKFLGLYDPVDMAAGIGDKETIPSNVVDAAVGIRGSVTNLGIPSRSRPQFNTIDGGPEDISKMRSYSQKTFPGTHSALGGAPWAGDHPAGFTQGGDIAVSSQVDKWMRSKAGMSGVNLKTPQRLKYSEQCPGNQFKGARHGITTFDLEQ